MGIMKYPNGETVAIGDLIWFEDGVCVGFVELIVAEESEFKSSGMDAPYILVNNIHPFEVALQADKYELGVPGYGGRMGIEVPSFVDEGIGLLTASETSYFEDAVKSATSKIEVLYSYYCVRAEVGDNSENWVFYFYNKKR